MMQKVVLAKKGLKTVSAASKAACVAEAGTGVGAVPAAVQLGLTFIVDEGISRVIDWGSSTYEKAVREDELKNTLEEARLQLIQVLENPQATPDDIKNAQVNVTHAFSKLLFFYNEDVQMKLEEGLEEVENKTQELKRIINAGPIPGIIGHDNSSVERTQRQEYNHAQVQLNGNKEFGIEPLEASIMKGVEKEALPLAQEAQKKMQAALSDQKKFYNKVFNQGFKYQNPDMKKQQCLANHHSKAPLGVYYDEVGNLDSQRKLEESMFLWIKEHNEEAYHNNLEKWLSSSQFLD